MPTTKAKAQTIVLEAPPETVGQRIAREIFVAILAGLVVSWIREKKG